MDSHIPPHFSFGSNFSYDPVTLWWLLKGPSDTLQLHCSHKMLERRKREYSSWLVWNICVNVPIEVRSSELEIQKFREQ